MSAGAINRLVETVRSRNALGTCYLIESGADQHQLFVPDRRRAGLVPAAGADIRTTTLEQALHLYLVEIEPADWATAPAELVATFRLPPGAVPQMRLKTIRPYGLEARVSA